MSILAKQWGLACAVIAWGTVYAEEWELQAPPSCGSVTECRVVTSKLHFDQTPDGVVPRVDGDQRGLVPGYPDLPVLVRVISIPVHCAAEVRIDRVDMVETGGVRVVAVPGQRVVEDGDRRRLEPAPAEPAGVFSQNAFWPDAPLRVEVADRGTQRWARVICYPVQYNPVTGALRWNRVVEARLLWRHGGDEGERARGREPGPGM